MVESQNTPPAIGDDIPQTWLVSENKPERLQLLLFVHWRRDVRLAIPQLAGSLTEQDRTPRRFDSSTTAPVRTISVLSVLGTLMEMTISRGNTAKILPEHPDRGLSPVVMKFRCRLKQIHHSIANLLVLLHLLLDTKVAPQESRKIAKTCPPSASSSRKRTHEDKETTFIHPSECPLRKKPC